MAQLTGGRHAPDAIALSTLFDALGRLPASGRLRLLESLRADACAAGVDPGPWLAEPLARETHPSVVRALLDRLDKTPPGSRAWWEVGTRGGRALLTRPMGKGRTIWLEIRWGAGSHVRGGEAEDDEIARMAHNLTAAGPRRVAAALAPLLYRMRASGSRLPDEARAFARLF